MTHNKLEDAAKQMIEDAKNMTVEETLVLALKHVVMVADALNHRALAVNLCPGHGAPDGHKIVHGDILFRAENPRDCMELLWMIVDGMASTAIASPTLNPIAGPLHELRKHIEDLFGLANMRTEATELVDATGLHHVPDMDRGTVQ